MSSFTQNDLLNLKVKIFLKWTEKVNTVQYFLKINTLENILYSQYKKILKKFPNVSSILTKVIPIVAKDYGLITKSFKLQYIIFYVNSQSKLVFNKTLPLSKGRVPK